jgi:hypothetical protein
MGISEKRSGCAGGIKPQQPLPAGAGVASNGIKERTTAVQLPVVQYHDVDIGDAYAIQKLCVDFIKPVFNHIAAPVLSEKSCDGWQRHNALKSSGNAELSQDGRIAEITGRWITCAAKRDRTCMTQYLPKTLRVLNRGSGLGHSMGSPTDAAVSNIKRQRPRNKQFGPRLNPFGSLRL